MAIETPCQTPGANFTTHIMGTGTVVIIDYGRNLTMTKKAATLLEANIHNALELVFAPYFLE